MSGEGVRWALLLYGFASLFLYGSLSGLWLAAIGRFFVAVATAEGRPTQTRSARTGWRYTR